jgi:hypothetical protein
VKDWKTQFYQPARRTMPLMAGQRPIFPQRQRKSTLFFPPGSAFLNPAYFFHIKNTK